MNPLTQPPLFWEAFFLILCRLGTVLMIAPIFGNRSTPAQVKIFFSLLLTLVMLPLVTTNLTALPDTMPAFLGLVAREVFIGGMVGFAVLLVFISLQAAGHIIGLQMGFSLANVVNPLTADHASLLDQFYGLLAALIFLTINGHHALIVAIRRTFDLVPLGQAEVGLPAAPVLLGWGREIFTVASRISLPVMAALLLTDVALAIIARSVPQLNVFVVGMPVKLIVGFGMLVITLPLVAVIMARLFGGMDETIGLLLRGI
jgi:flagellar biosynthetic protein FliR